MFKFYTIIADNFLNDPLLLRRIALEDTTYKKSTTHSGVRTDNLYVKYNNLTSLVNKKILNLYNVDVVSYDAMSFFHITDGKYPGGWVHSDSVDLAAIIYLSPDSKDTLDNGTSLFRWKNYNGNDKINIDKMRESFIEEEKISEMEEYRNIHNSAYVETVRTGEKFNRLFTYDGNMLHCAHGYYGEERTGRLVWLSFFSNIRTGSGTPVSRMREFII